MRRWIRRRTRFSSSVSRASSAASRRAFSSLISAFIVEKGFRGFSVAQKLDKMGYRGSPLGELVFEDCEVPAENRVADENRGNVVMMSGLDLERAMAAPMSIGIGQRALDLALEHAKTRVQFGKPIATFQMIQSKLAEMYASPAKSRKLAR